MPQVLRVIRLCQLVDLGHSVNAQALPHKSNMKSSARNTVCCRVMQKPAKRGPPPGWKPTVGSKQLFGQSSRTLPACLHLQELQHDQRDLRMASNTGRHRSAYLGDALFTQALKLLQKVLISSTQKVLSHVRLHLHRPRVDAPAHSPARQTKAKRVVWMDPANPSCLTAD